MSNVIELPVQEQRYDQASEWIARLDRQLSEEEDQALQTWLERHPDNQYVLLEMAALWDKMDSLQRLSSLFPKPQSGAQQQTHRFYTWASAAAIVLLVMGLWLTGILNIPVTDNANPDFVYQTDIGEQSTVTLQDGTQMVLNTNTEVLVNYTPNARLLTLQRGEVYVQVAKDPNRPLSVIAGNNFVQAIGTAFNVEINSEQAIELVVVEGTVKVGVHRAANKKAMAKSPEAVSDNSRMLVAGESLLMAQSPQPVKTVSADDIEVKLSWRRGNLIFRGESLQEAVQEIERYTSVEFVLKDENLKNIRVAGLFRAGDVDGLLATLKENFNIAYQYTNDQKVELNSLASPPQ